MFRAQLLIWGNASISRHRNESHLQIITLFLFYLSHVFHGVLLEPDSYSEDIIIEEISIPALLTGFA